MHAVRIWASYESRIVPDGGHGGLLVDVPLGPQPGGPDAEKPGQRFKILSSAR
jgi:hypothetical protein